MIKYCSNCVLPNTRPNIILDKNGVCNACLTHASRKKINWKKRERIFKNIISNAKSISKGYDCLIPVSGGKDSTWQVVHCLKYGLKPLAVTWRPPARTKIGSINLNNLISLGVDHIDYQINPSVEKIFIYKAFEKYGNPAIPMHMALFNIPIKIAVNFNISLIIWGENSAFEYGGEKNDYKYIMDNKWLKRYGVMQGTTAKNWISKDLTAKQLTPYFGINQNSLIKNKVMAIFLGYFFPWDPMNSLKVAKANGFQIRKEGPKTGYYNYADIDDDFISVHHYIKWYKFGFTRIFDNLSLEIRNKRITRKQAIEIIKEKGDQTPCDDIEKFCHFLGIKVKEFFEIIEKFRNPNIWVRRNNRWVIDNFIIPDWNWK